MDRCPVCNELMDGGLICFNCNFDNRILKTIQQFEEQNSDAEPVKQGRGIVAKSVIRRHRQKWLGTLREFEFDFSYTKLKKYKGPSATVIVPYGVEVIEGAFSNNLTIRKVVLPDTITTIGRDAFSFCRNLESVHIPDKTTHIEKDAFWGCKSLAVLIPKNVSVIEEDAFTQVKSIYVSGDNAQFLVNQDLLIDVQRGTVLAAAFQTEGMDIIVPEGVKRIGTRAFNIARNVPSSIILPRSLVSIGEGALVNVAKKPVLIPNSVSKIENDAFAKRTEVKLEEGNPNYIQKDNLIVEISTSKLISVCNKSCDTVLIPSGIKTIADRAFMDCQHIAEISIPRSVVSIGHYAFSGCESLRSIVIPRSVIQMGHAVFDGCFSLHTVFCEHESTPSGWLETWSKGCRAQIDGCAESDRKSFKRSPALSIDKMNGHDFEYFCAELLRKNGFSDVKVTKGSGDQGVDILAKKDGIKYAIQCKNYASHLGNSPVQEVNAGKIYYKCHVGVVMTNSTFTQGAKTLAEATGVLLWDGSILTQMMENAN